MTRSTRRLLGLALAAGALAACSDDTGPNYTPITAADAASIGAAAASTADLAVAAISPGVPDFSTGLLPFLAVGRQLPGGLALSPPDSLPNCPAAADTADTDGDGVPDDATWVFNAGDCTRTDIEGNASVVTGAVGVSDPGLTPGYNLNIQALSARYFETGHTDPSLQLDLDGMWALRGTSDALSLDQNYRFALMVLGESATLTNDLQVDFAAAEGTAIAWGAPLPDGLLAINGNWEVTGRDETRRLTLTTIEPLVYDDTCGGLTGGVLMAAGSGGQVVVTWTGCQLHTAEFVGN